MTVYKYNFSEPDLSIKYDANFFKTISQRIKKLFLIQVFMLSKITYLQVLMENYNSCIQSVPKLLNLQKNSSDFKPKGSKKKSKVTIKCLSRRGSSYGSSTEAINYKELRKQQ